MNAKWYDSALATIIVFFVAIGMASSIFSTSGHFLS